MTHFGAILDEPSQNSSVLDLRPMARIERVIRSVIRKGQLTVIDAAGRRRLFRGQLPGPEITVRLRGRRLPLRLLFNPSLALGEAYMDGNLVLEHGSLRDLLDLLTEDLPTIESRPIQKLNAALGRRRIRRNHRQQAQANAEHHYDLSGALYDLFLDADRQYSCGYFRTGNETLEEAQMAKKRHVAAKLMLEPGSTVLDIGSGWGGLALNLAKDEGAQVTGITLSVEQLEHARSRAKSSGLSGQVRFDLLDFRDIRETYDRIVSVGMFEHVGNADYPAFFDTVARSLRADGIALIHSIGRMEPPGGSDPWISKYIFPGGYIPALSEVLAAVEKSGLWVTDIEILRVHYADTLRQWHDRFQARREEAVALYDERFCRMWEFYLAACEMLFRNGPLMVFQLQLSHRKDAVPLTRDYIAEYEDAPETPRKAAAGQPS
ncbi:MAG: cyclopropane-fatty-acyl-phospholipid synthase family protein [Sphingobium sp.]